MNLDDSIKNAVERLICDGTFNISQLVIDEKNFGNVVILLKSNSEIDVRFIKDRGDYWCEIGHSDEWYFVKDVFSAIGIKAIPKENDFIDMITESSTSIKMNLPQILKAFDAKNIKNTQVKIKDSGTKRAMNMFKS